MSESNLEETVDRIQKEFGKGSVMRLTGEDNQSVESIPTGSLKLDMALGVGGLPKGRIVEVFGPESCLAPDTFVQYEIRKPNGDRVNHKGGSIERLYHRFNGLPTGDGRVDRHPADDYVFYAPSMNEKGRIVQNRIRGVVYTGRQRVYQVVTKSGNTIEATEEHRFFVGDGFERLKNLDEGSSVYIHNRTPYRVDGYDYENNKEWMVKDHPNPELPTKTVDGKYEYVRLQEGRAVLEAEANGLTPEEYRARLNDGDVDGLEYIPTTLDIHHKDRDTRNNDPSNLVALSPQEHNKIHAIENEDKLRFMVVEDEIASIKRVGVKETYDIKMAAPHHNFVAEGIVVHNSGKTTLATHVAAEAQKKGGNVAFIDAEHTFDPPYAQKIGVQLEPFVLSQPNTGEEALGIVDRMVKSGEFDVVIVDSVSALVPQAELEGDMGDSHVGLQARLMSQAMRKLTGLVKETDTMVLFINQIRMKVGVRFGNPETTSGGKALRFYSSVRLDIRRVGKVEDGGEEIGDRCRVWVKKNKVAAPKAKIRFDLIYGEGISRMGEIVDLGVEHGILTRAGAWYSYEDDSLAQGKENLKAHLEENPELTEEIEKKIRAKINE